MGYLRLAAFTQKAGAEVRAAVEVLQEAGVRGYILDLRDNPGGVIAAGMEVAKVRFAQKVDCARPARARVALRT